MKNIVLVLFLVKFSFLNAQTFTLKTQNPPVSDFGSGPGSASFADIDGDGDLDMVITGSVSGLGKTSRLYKNDGSGNFSEQENVLLDNVSNGAVAFSDIDGDNDQDLLITGENRQLERVAKLYLNDGFGNFNEQLDSNLEGVLASCVSFADLNDDGNEDLIIVGTRESSQGISSILYMNNGNGEFSESFNTPFEPVRNGSIAVSDIDDDGDYDVLISGENQSFIEIARLYENDGFGNFSLLENSELEGVSNGSISFVDIDGDLDEDLFISGISDSSILVSNIYLNNGLGVFEEMTSSALEPVHFSSVDFSDIDNDSDQDLLITGRGLNGNISKLYLNDGIGNFSEVLDIPFESLVSSFVSFADLNGDLYDDILLTGFLPQNGNILEPSTNIYLNDATTSSFEFNMVNNKLEVYPNPNYGSFLYVNLYTQNANISNIKIFDMKGNVVLQEDVITVANNVDYRMDISSFTPGIYLIQVFNGVDHDGSIFLVK